jgi:hypothetical protein
VLVGVPQNRSTRRLVSFVVGGRCVLLSANQVTDRTKKQNGQGSYRQVLNGMDLCL